MEYYKIQAKKIIPVIAIILSVVACIIASIALDKSQQARTLDAYAKDIATCWQDASETGGYCETEFIRDKNGDIIGLDIIRH